MELIITIPLLMALTVGITEVIKLLKMPSRLLPLVALIIGVGVTFVAQIEAAYSITILLGIMIGLSSCGLFSGVKATFARVKK